MRGRPHEKLEIWRIAHALALRVHRLTLRLPKFELYEEGGQARRSSKSVSNQIVEGHALRRYKSEYLHYLWRSYGSAEETIEHLRFLLETESVRTRDREEAAALQREYAGLASKIFNYALSVDEQHDVSLYVREQEEPYEILGAERESRDEG